MQLGGKEMNKIIICMIIFFHPSHSHESFWIFILLFSILTFVFFQFSLLAFLFSLKWLACMFYGNKQSNLALRLGPTMANTSGEDHVDCSVLEMSVAREVREDSVFDADSNSDGSEDGSHLSNSDGSENDSRFRDSSVDPVNVISGNYDHEYFSSETDSDDEDYVPVARRSARRTKATETTQKTPKKTAAKVSSIQTRQKRPASKR